MASLKIKNFIANPVRVGIFGVTDDMSVRIDVDAGATVNTSLDSSFVAKHCFVVAWDNLAGGGNPTVVCKAINIESNNGLNIKPNTIDAFTPV
jgi:hypothetical protein